MSGARFLVFHILFDAEDGSVIGVNDHIENLSTLDDLNLVLAFLVFVFRLGSGAAHFPFSSAYGLGATNSVYQLQKKEAFAGLILEVPFDNLMNVVRLVVPVPLPLEVIMRDKYDNLAMIENIKSPILIMGGSIDTTVPVELAQNLYNYAPEPKKIIIYENGKHSNLFNFRNDLDILDWMKANENGWLKSE